MKLYYCDGYWKEDNEPFHYMVVADGVWDGIEDAKDQRIFYYTDEVLPVIGDHGDFVITNAEEMK